LSEQELQQHRDRDIQRRQEQEQEQRNPEVEEIGSSPPVLPPLHERDWQDMTEEEFQEVFGFKESDFEDEL
jgi:hypothetical protein